MKHLEGDATRFVTRSTYGSERWLHHRRGRHIVKPNDTDVFRHAHTGFAKRSNGVKCRFCRRLKNKISAQYRCCREVLLLVDFRAGVAHTAGAQLLGIRWHPVISLGPQWLVAVLYPVVEPAWVAGNIEADSTLIAGVGPSHVKQPGAPHHDGPDPLGHGLDQRALRLDLRRRPRRCGLQTLSVHRFERSSP